MYSDIGAIAERKQSENRAKTEERKQKTEEREQKRENRREKTEERKQKRENRSNYISVYLARQPRDKLSMYETSSPMR
jgi:hypothetical protein